MNNLLIISFMKNALLIFMIFSLILACKSYKDSMTTNKSNDSVSVFFHVEKVKLGSMTLNQNNTVIGFVFSNLDTLGKINWTSNKITDYKMDGFNYFFKLNLPESIANNSLMFRCETFYRVVRPDKQIDTISSNYGGSTTSNINLILKSTPQGADVFLIPNRTWLNNFENKSWDKDSLKLEYYRVNKGPTNTYSKIDETVYVVLFKFKNKYIKRINFTQPASIDRNPIVSVNF